VGEQARDFDEMLRTRAEEARVVATDARLALRELKALASSVREMMERHERAITRLERWAEEREKNGG
jgi:hypothetical protein